MQFVYDLFLLYVGLQSSHIKNSSITKCKLCLHQKRWLDPQIGCCNDSIGLLGLDNNHRCFSHRYVTNEASLAIQLVACDDMHNFIHKISKMHLTMAVQ